MTETSELQKLLGAATPGSDASCDQCGGYGETFGHAPDCHSDDCALACGIDDCNGQVEVCQCTIALQDAAVNALPDLLATISRLAAERDALVKALRPFQRYAESVLKDTRLGGRANDDRHIYRLDGTKITYGDLRRARALVRDGGGA